MIGYGRLLVARNKPYQSQRMDIISVISLGHTVREPLMWSSSELSYGSEPHGHITQLHTATARTGSHAGVAVGVPGVGMGGYRGGVYTGYYPAVQN